MEQIALDWAPEPHYFSVSELTSAMRGLLAESFTDIWVAGEISGVKLAASGHYYFTLKDEGAQLRCVCYKMTARYLKFKPQDGIAVLARGRVDLYDVRGEVQLIVEAIEEETRGGGAVRPRSQAPAAGFAGAHRDRNLADRSGDPRHASCP
jgi:exodeoxyribonuclease VII large subunit